jgi:hypothetical protein
MEFEVGGVASLGQQFVQVGEVLSLFDSVEHDVPFVVEFSG